MNDKDNRPNSDRTKGDVSLLVLVVQNVPLCQCKRVVKSQFGGAEIDAVLCKVFVILFVVPFKGHDFNLSMIAHLYVHTYRHFGQRCIRAISLHLQFHFGGSAAALILGGLGDGDDLGVGF